jgi:hypothetical protein
MNRTAWNLHVHLIFFITFFGVDGFGAAPGWALPARGGEFRDYRVALAGELFLGISRP